MFSRLIRICKPAHATHDTEDIVICRVDTDLGVARRDGRRGEGELEGRVIDTGHVACARGLVLLGLKAEGVDIDACGRDVGVVLVGLDKIEVAAHALRETIMTVKLELSGEDGIEASVDTRNTNEVTGGKAGVRVRESLGGDGTGRIGTDGGREVAVGGGGGASGPGGVDGISVIEPLFAKRGSHVGGRHVIIFLDNPDKFLAGVIEVELDLVGDRGNGLVAGELNLLDEVFVGDLGEAAALVGVEEDVVRVKRGGLERGGRDGAGGVVAIRSSTELEVDLDLVVLESDEGEGESGVTAEPELEGNVEIKLGDETLGDNLGEGGDVTNHVLVANLLALSLGELVPDVHPVTVVLVNALAANLDLGVLDKIVAEVVEPAEFSTSRGGINLGDGDLKVNTRKKITITGDGACYALAEIGRAVEGLLDGLHREISVASVNHLEESDLRIAGKVDILGAIGYELH